MADNALLYRWQDLVKSPEGPPDPVLRLVCLVVGSWMKTPQAPEAQVSLPTLADQVGIATRNVRKRVRQLEGVWLDVERPAGRRPVFRPRIPAQGELVPSLEELSTAAGADVDNSPTPDAPVRGVRELDPGWARPGSPDAFVRPPRTGPSPDTYSLPTSDLGAGAGLGAPEGPAGAAPGPGGEQLPMPRLLSRVVKALKDEDQEAMEEAIQQMKEASGG